MSIWSDAKSKIAIFRNYVNGLTPTAQAQAKFSFLVSKDEIKNMLDQAGGPQQLDGLRIYFGADIVDGQMVPTVYVVAEKVDTDGGYSDYKIGTTEPTVA